MEISVDGIGRPTEPLNGSSTRFMHPAGDVSVSPHAWVIAFPVTRCQHSATDACTAMPPPSVTFKRLKLTAANAGALSSALKSVLTPLKNVNGYFFISPMSVGRSRGLTIRMFRHPSDRNRKQFAVSAKIWY